MAGLRASCQARACPFDFAPFDTLRAPCATPKGGAPGLSRDGSGGRIPEQTVRARTARVRGLMKRPLEPSRLRMPTNVPSRQTSAGRSVRAPHASLNTTATARLTGERERGRGVRRNPMPVAVPGCRARFAEEPPEGPGLLTGSLQVLVVPRQVPRHPVALITRHGQPVELARIDD